MLARARILGHIPGVHIGDEFFYRAEVKLIGLHRHMFRGISTCVHTDQEVAACVVANYQDHNFLITDDIYIYGGEGGELTLAHRFHLRVLADQRLTNGNSAMIRSIHVENLIRLVVRTLMADNTRRYIYLGHFIVTDYDIIESNGFDVYEFLLEREE